MPSRSAGSRPGGTAVVSVHAAAALTSFAWLAEDAARAPDLAAREPLSRAAAAQMDHYAELLDLLRARTAEPHELIAPFLQLFEGAGARTEPADWGERLLRTVVMGGMVRDLTAALADLLDPVDRERAMAARHDPGDVTTALLAPLLGAGEPVRARLSLWGRRLAGEALGMLPPVIAALVAAATHEGDDGDGATVAALHPSAMAAMSQGHAHRMERLGLAA